MPMIDGIKMACEPCIRGHRSTKCNHAAERVMLPVRKPGRPLSICPHPPNNGCACATVTAALPRSRKCGCGSKSAGVAGASGASSNGAASSSSKQPRSPSKRAFFKAPTSPKSMARGRIDPSALGRTDVSQMKIHAPPPSANGWPTANGHPPSNINDLSSLAGAGHPNGGHGQYMLPNEPIAFFANGGAGQAGEQQAMFQNGTPGGAYGQHGYPLQNPGGESMYANGGHNDFSTFFDSSMAMDGGDLGGYGLNLNPRAGEMNGFHGMQFQAAPAVSAPPPPAVSSPAAKGSCCGPAPATESARHTPTSSTNSLASNGGSGTTATSTSNTKGSCCSGGSGSPVTATSSSQHTMLKSESSIGGAPGTVPLSSIPLAATAGDVKPNGHIDQYALQQQQVYQGYAPQSQPHGAPTWYRYPPEYGTVTAPLQQSQWRSSLTVTSGPNPNGGVYMQQQPQGYNASAMQQQQQQQQQHQSHPYAIHTGNVDDMHMCSCGDGCECVGCVAHPYNNATQDTVRNLWTSLMDDTSSTGSGRTATATTTVTLPPQASGDGTSPSQQVFTPSASDTSGVSDDQVSLDASNFLFVSYSVTGCEGEGLTCPCGDDCQCVGCTIHNNTL